MPALLASRKRVVKPALAGAALLAGLAMASAQQQPPRIATAELADAMSVYVDGVVELRQFHVACSKDPADWDRGSELLVGSLQAAGLAASSASDFRARLAASGGGSAKYDCTGAVAAARLEIPRPEGWPAYHSVLERIGIKPVDPRPPEDSRMTALLAVFAEYVPPQKKALNCTALIHVDWFPQSYADWEDVLDKAAASIAAAGFDAEAVETLVGPARAAELMQPVADRQAAITACVGDTTWMNWLGTFALYSLPSDIEKALGGAL